MKKTITLLALVLTTTITKAQTTADLQNLTLSPNTYWNGSISNSTVNTVGTFTSGNCIFPNAYTGSSGIFSGYWANGWAYSNMKDSTTAGLGNQYSARTAVGYTNSTIYSLGQGGSILKFNATAQGKQMAGFYLTNNTYAAISMRDGDMFGKKFGGVSGNDPDWFKLKVQKYLGGVLFPDSVTFYLADFRSSNNSLDYILKTWQYVNLTSLGNVDSLAFTLSSSDNSGGYMNTPSYFCLDNFTTLNTVTSITKNSIESNLYLYPNPTANELNIDIHQNISNPVNIKILDFAGKEVFSKTSELLKNNIDLSNLQQGIYFVEIQIDGIKVVNKIIKR